MVSYKKKIEWTWLIFRLINDFLKSSAVSIIFCITWFAFPSRQNATTSWIEVRSFVINPVTVMCNSWSLSWPRSMLTPIAVVNCKNWIYSIIIITLFISCAHCWCCSWKKITFSEKLNWKDDFYSTLFWLTKYQIRNIFTLEMYESAVCTTRLPYLFNVSFLLRYLHLITSCWLDKF